jgi:hypothetical protein
LAAGFILRPDFAEPAAEVLRFPTLAEAAADGLDFKGLLAVATLTDSLAFEVFDGLASTVLDDEGFLASTVAGGEATST